MPAPLHIGLTGNIASGKSTVARQLAACGATIIDADILAREAVAVGTPGFKAVVAHFGPDVLTATGSLNRAALRTRVFGDATARNTLNAIVHPAVQQLRDARLRSAADRGDPVVISDIPLLFEVGLERGFDGIVLVDAPADMRRDRLVRDRGLTADEAQAMIAAQWPSDRKRAKATWVIDNDGTPEQLQARVAEVWRIILELADRRRTTTPAS
ncbi:MAG: dephospho-CoA kinase [Gemmatimonadaceae bacterium]|nr:dephospho-CoA kinase [Gemmatimonadaceae bacterium]